MTPFGLQMLICQVIYYCKVLLNFKKVCIPVCVQSSNLTQYTAEYGCLENMMAGEKMLQIRNKSLKAHLFFVFWKNFSKVIRTDSSVSDLSYLCMNNQCYKYSWEVRRQLRSQSHIQGTQRRNVLRDLEALLWFHEHSCWWKEWLFYALSAPFFLLRRFGRKLPRLKKRQLAVWVGSIRFVNRDRQKLRNSLFLKSFGRLRNS